MNKDKNINKYIKVLWKEKLLFFKILLLNKFKNSKTHKYN